MNSSCLRHTELPHTSRLFSDFTYHFDRVRPFYSYDPHDPESFRAAARQIQFPDDRRAALVSALREQNGGHAALDILAQPGTLAVVTGQQAGLFTGPAYTVYKALTAIRVARELSDSGIPAVPVFWVATEDHDFAEVNHAWVFDGAHKPVRIEIADANPSRRPVGEIPVEGNPAEALWQALSGFPFAEEAFELVRDAYAQGRTLGAAFAEALKRMFSSYGLLCLDPMNPAMRSLAAPLLRAAVAAMPELVSDLLARNRELAAAGYHEQVHVEEQTSLVFLLEGGERIALRRNGADYAANGRRYSAQELMDRAGQLSPNALLRPVVQDYMLPTVAYAGGPAELAYLAQSQVLYRTLLHRAPVALHRASFTLLDGRAGRLMARYGLHLPDFFHGEEAVRERVSQRLIPPALGGRIGETQAQAERLLEHLQRDLLGFDPTLAAALDKSRAKILYQISKLERKVAREALRRDEQARRGAEYLCNLIYPERHLQERFYSILPFLAAHGPDLIARLHDNLVLACPDHRILVV